MKIMNKRADIILKGRVQKAGFRDYIDEVAYNLNINGWVKNLEDNTVKIVCEDKSDSLEKFITRIQIKEYPIRVEEAIVEYSAPIGEFIDFTIIREDDIVQATYERMDAAGRYMREMNRNLSGKFDNLLDMQKQTLNKQDESIKILNNINNDTSEIKSTLKTTEMDIRGARFSLSHLIETKFKEHDEDIAQIKTILAKVQEAIKAT